MQQKSTFFTGSILLLLGFGSCATLKQPTLEPTQREYISVDYNRFTSGTFVREFKNKYVKIEATFASQAAEALPEGYSADRYVAFWAASRSGYGPESPKYLTVVVPKHTADLVFELKHGEPVTLYGLAVPVITTSRIGKTYEDLILEAQRVEQHRDK